LQTVTLAFKVYESLASQTFGRRDFALILKLKSLRFDALNEVALMVTCVQFQIVVCFRPFLTEIISILLMLKVSNPNLQGSSVSPPNRVTGLILKKKIP
jgi:hypothetical protein